MAKGDRLSRLTDTYQQWADRKESSPRLAFERKIIRKILDICGVGVAQRAVNAYKWESENNKDYYLTIGWLNTTYPSFPFKLTVYEEDWKPRILDLMTPSRRNNGLWAAWQQAKSEYHKEYRDGHSIGVLVRCHPSTGLSPALIIHNTEMPSGPFETEPPNKLQVVYDNTRSNERLYLQHFDYFTAQLALKWQMSDYV